MRHREQVGFGSSTVGPLELLSQAERPIASAETPRANVILFMIYFLVVVISKPYYEYKSWTGSHFLYSF